MSPNNLYVDWLDATLLLKSWVKVDVLVAVLVAALIGFPASSLSYVEMVPATYVRLHDK